ncbi:MCE family protein [Mycobacterium palustre]|uniref:Mammalian cell entry protein n=1 Tax=Mycobacterium palustre TaxID=153971 RepID=A0A1X1ZVL7_9MYCO|nr:MCE family protein [Mycobacterium palustre]MCV7099874.1 MCE family protein [Mycobacterium palustre]ORW28140.1 mammalian cell entry protein [Mycobacterium palustre]
MRGNLSGAVWRLAIFMTVCAAGTFALLLVFAQLRFQDEHIYEAVFTNVSGLKEGDFVRIAGVEVGKVKKISINRQGQAVVAFSADDTVVLTEGTKVLIRYNNLIGDRFVQLEEGAGSVKRLNPGQTIPVNRTEPALDLDALIGGFRPLFRALNPEQVNALSTQLIQAFQGQGESISSFLTQTASFTSTLADRDALISQVIGNLNTVLVSLGDQSKQFDKTVDSLSKLVQGLAERKVDISNSIAYSNAAAASIADLLSQSREPFKDVVAQLDRASTQVLSDREYVDNILKGLPGKYRILNRLGLSGDFFTFYLCDLVLKVNGKGGQPVYIKLAGQTTGRCTPK